MSGLLKKGAPVSSFLIKGRLRPPATCSPLPRGAFPGVAPLASSACLRAFLPCGSFQELYSQLQQCLFYVPLTGFI
jgi:hypothetical protein